MRFFSSSTEFNDNSSGLESEVSSAQARVTSASLLGTDLRFVSALLTAHRKTELCNSTDADGHHDDRPGERRHEQRDSDGYASARGEEVDTNVARVLSDEVNQSDAKDSGHDDANPSGRRSRVAEMLSTMLLIAVMSRHACIGHRSCRRFAHGLPVIALAHVDPDLSWSKPARTEFFLQHGASRVRCLHDTAVRIRSEQGALPRRGD